MELQKLSKFKLHLHALISQVRELKEKECNASQHLQLTIQKQKQIEEEFNKKLAELHAELGFSNERGHKLERKVNCLENEISLLENRHKELEGSLHSLLESREAFLKAYEDSTYEMKRDIQDRDRKIDILSEKLKAHLSLFDSVSKEASSINKLMDDTRQALSQREDVVIGLKRKMDEVSTFEKLFSEKINKLESKLTNNEVELSVKTKRILELEVELEAATFTKEFQPEITQLQRDVSTKELLLQNLISENKGLRSEVGSLGIVIKRIQNAVTCMSEKDRKTFTSLLEGQEERLPNSESAELRMQDAVQTGKEPRLNSSMIKETSGVQFFTNNVQFSNASSPEVQVNKIHCYASERVHSPSRSGFSVPQSEADDTSVCAAEAKDDYTELVNQLDSEGSTTQVEIL